jgi:hypothetical protein
VSVRDNTQFVEVKKRTSIDRLARPLFSSHSHNPVMDGIHAHRRSNPPPAVAACLSIPARRAPNPLANWPTLIEVRLDSRRRPHPSRTRSRALRISTPLGYGELQAVSVARLAAALSVPSAAAWSPGSPASIFGSPSTVVRFSSASRHHHTRMSS